MTSIQNSVVSKRASWLELFYDLVFVAIIAQFTYVVADQTLNLENVVITIVIGYMIFTAWWGTTVSRNLQDSETTRDRLYVQLLMVVALLLSILMPDVFNEGDVSRFFLAYALVRLIQLLMLFRLYRLKPEEAPVTHNIAQAFAISIGLFVLGSFLPLHYALIAAASGLAFEIFGPMTTGKGNKTRFLNVSHLQERLGLFLLLIMGESVLVVALTNTAVAVDIVRPLVIIAGVLNMIALWWLYFAHLEKEAEGVRPANLIVYLNAHAVLFGSIVLLASAYKNILKHGYEYVVGDVVLFSTGSFLLIAALIVIRHAIFGFAMKKIRLLLSMLSIFILVGYVSYVLQSIYFLTLSTSLLLLLLLSYLDEKRRTKQKAPATLGA